jgi:hypothetical protein
VSEWFVFVVLALASFRLQRVVTTDEWPPTQWFRDKVADRTGADSSWTTLFTCPWCFGMWVSAVVVVEHRYLGWVPFWVYSLLAGAAVAGLLAEWSDSD